MEKIMESIEDTVEEMKRLKAILPPRPSLEDVCHATQMIGRADSSLASRLDYLFQQATPPQLPYHVFRAYLQMREEVMREKAQDEKAKYVKIKELEDRHKRFDVLIEKAQSAASHALINSALQEGSAHDYKLVVANMPDGSMQSSLPTVSEDTSYTAQLLSTSPIVCIGSTSFRESTSADHIAKTPTRELFLQEACIAGSQPDGEDNQDGCRQYSFKVSNAIEIAKTQRLADIKLANMDLEWIPELIGELTNLTSLDLTGNLLQALPESIGELCKLTSLNVQSNQLTALPDSVGCLTNLRSLNIQMNRIVELPITIGLCIKLEGLLADFNNLKVLPEATGNLTSLQKLSIYMNHVQRLPTALSNLKHLVEVDVHFNRLERISDSICYLPNLTKLDVSSNFTELRELPNAIGLMPSIRELHISNNAISTLPVSFARLTRLEKLEMEPNPWVLPPLDVVRRGKEAVLAFMAELAENEVEVGKEVIKKPSIGTRLSSLFRKNKNLRSPYVVKPVNPLQLRA